MKIINILMFIGVLYCVNGFAEQLKDLKPYEAKTSGNSVQVEVYAPITNIQDVINCYDNKQRLRKECIKK